MVRLMKLNQMRKWIFIAITAFLFTGIWIALLPETNSIKYSDTMIGITTASANAHLGIQGHAAPELVLNIWIDGDGKKMEPIHLKDLRGKVVYLYFFQDW